MSHELRAKSILITGGAGFIGSHLCKALLDKGNKVICMDNFITGSRQNIEPFSKNPDFKLVEHDISSPIEFEEDLDWVLHFASLASPKAYLGYPIKTLKSGLLGTHNCLGIAREKNTKFMLASTSEIYGDPLVHPQPETYWGNVSCTGVRSCYDESKRGAESLTYAYMREHKVDVRVVRIFNTYGPNMDSDDGRVVSNFIVQALQKKDLTIYGDGKQSRSFCYISDLIEGILRIMDIDDNSPINLGNPDEFDITQLAEKVLELTGSKSALKFFPLPEDDPKQRQPDISKAKELLGWQPRVRLEEGLSKTIDYFRERLK